MRALAGPRRGRSTGTDFKDSQRLARGATALSLAAEAHFREDGRALHDPLAQPEH